MTRVDNLAASDAAKHLSTISRRRHLLGALSGLGTLSVLGCGGGGSDGGSSAAAADTTGTSGTTTTASGALVLDADTEAALSQALASANTCSVVPQETEGPYPLRAILSNSAMVRADITEGTRTGVPLTLRIKVINNNASCAPVSGAWVYIWHCDKDGLYSGYSGSGNAGQAGLTYLRGIQATDSSGIVTFKTIYPGWYIGRITHIHCMVFLAGTTLGTSSASTATTQFAFPLATTASVYASSLYTKGQNTSVTSFAADNVFSDGTTLEMLTLSGTPAKGYAGGIVVGINGTST